MKLNKRMLDYLIRRIKMRNITVVMKQMLDCVPKQNENYHFMKADFDRIAYDASFRAPEAAGIDWRNLQQALQQYVPNLPVEDWHFNVLSVFSTMSVEAIREDVAKRMAA